MSERKIQVTTAKVLANHANGQNGGVKTEEGKKISSQNAIGSGLFVDHLMPGESLEDFVALKTDVYRLRRPVGREEKKIVDEYISVMLRTSRASHYEAYLFWKYDDDEVAMEKIYPFRRSEQTVYRLMDRLEKKLEALQYKRNTLAYKGETFPAPYPPRKRHTLGRIS
jgi:hypothetical protein